MNDPEIVPIWWVSSNLIKILINFTYFFFCQIGKAQGFDKKHMKSAQPEVCVKMKNLENGTEFIWPKEKFLNRLYLMKEMYNNYEDEDDWDLPEEKDPFQEDLNQEICIGTSQVFMQPIAYMVKASLV